MADKLEKYVYTSIYVLVKDGKFVMGGGSSTRPSLKIYKSYNMAQSYAKRYGAEVHEYVSKDLEQRESAYNWSWAELNNHLSIFDVFDVSFYDGGEHRPFSGDSGVSVLRVTDVSPQKDAAGRVILHISTDANFFGPGRHRIMSDDYIERIINEFFKDEYTSDEKIRLQKAFGIGVPPSGEPFISSGIDKT